MFGGNEAEIAVWIVLAIITGIISFIIKLIKKRKIDES